MLLNFKHNHKAEGKVQTVPEIIKVLRLPQPDPAFNNKITCLNFGPYDNGYIILGTTSGHLVVLDPLSLKRMHSEKLFEANEGEISQINYEPT